MTEDASTWADEGRLLDQRVLGAAFAFLAE
jgi:hypothetical protein